MCQVLRILNRFMRQIEKFGTSAVHNTVFTESVIYTIFCLKILTRILFI